MCLAVPGKIVSINGSRARIDFEGLKREADISLIENPMIGEYVLVHVGFAIQKVDKKTAEQTYHILQELEE